MPQFTQLGSGGLTAKPVSFTSAPAQPNPAVAAGLTIGQGGQPLSNGLPVNPTNTQVAGLLVNGAPPSPTGGGNFPPLARPTATGGYVIHPTALPQGGKPALGNSNVEPLSNGGSASFGTNGGLSTINPSPYALNVSGSIPSDALTSSTSLNDVANKRNAYADYAQQLYQATIPSSDYLSALTGYQNAQQQGKQIQADFLTNPSYPGDTFGFAQGVEGRQLALNSLQQSAAANNLNVQQVIRSGNIDAYKALVGAAQPQSLAPGSSLISPLNGQTVAGGLGGYTDVQAAQTYSNLQQQFPDAQIPAYNQSLSPQQNLQMAQQAAAQSPSFQSRNLVPVQLPGGGYTFVNKNQLVTGPNGQAQIISSGDAAQADALKTSIGTLTDQGSQISSQIKTVDNNFPILLGIVSKYNLNGSVPLLNQFLNMTDKNIGQTGVTQLNAVATGLKATIAQIISRGGSVDNQTRNEADALLPSNASLKVLQDLYSVVKAEGAGVIKGINDTKQQNVNSLNDIYSKGTTPSAGTSTSNSSSGSIYNF